MLVKKMKNNVNMRKNFFLSQNLYGQKLTIRVENQGFYYDHDDVVNANKKRFSLGGSAYRSWSRHKYYTKTSGYPGWASNYIKKI